MKAITPDLEYLSTRQSAKVLQVSLGTVQKMVELGELIAWKTRGGHRRILVSSLEQQLHIKERLLPFVGEKITSIDGMGMEIGVRFKDAETCKTMQQSAFAAGLNVVVGSQANMQIMPPLTIPQDLLDRGLDILISKL